MTLTKEQIEMYASAADATQTFEMDKGKLIAVEPEHMQELARIALVSLEAEPVAWMVKDTDTGEKIIRSDRSCFEGFCQPLYTATLSPVVPAAIPKLKDGQRFKYVKDGIRYSANYANGWNQCRAAMLQGAEQQGQQQNIPENIPATQFKPVADLYGLTSSIGAETSFTFDAVEACDFIDGGWSCQEYVELERYQDAIAGNSPAISDGWVACSERMPSIGEKVLAYRPDAPESNDPLIKMATYVGGSAHGHGFDCYCKPTHWMPLPAAPH